MILLHPHPLESTEINAYGQRCNKLLLGGGGVFSDRFLKQPLFIPPSPISLNSLNNSTRYNENTNKEMGWMFSHNPITRVYEILRIEDR